MAPHRRIPDLVFIAAAIGAAALVLVSPALIRGEGLLPVGSLWRVPPWSLRLPITAGNGLLIDQLLEFWPWRLFWRSEMLAGRFPFWNPLIACGVPFAANPQTASFFPLTYLLLVLSPVLWSVAAAFIKIFVAGYFTALYLLRLGAGRRGAVQAGVVFALCGFMIAWLGHPHTNAICMLPVLFWGVSRAFDLATPRSWVVVSLGIAMVLVSGHPPTAIHVLVAATAYMAFRAFLLPAAQRGSRLSAAGLAAIAALALAAPSLLLTLEYISWSSTGASAAHLNRWSTHLPVMAVLQLVMPLSAGSPAHGAEVLQAIFGLGPQANFLERAGWIGLPALGLAAWALAARWREPHVRFHAGLAGFGLAAAFGLPPLPRLWNLLPGLSSTNPVRLLALFCFGVAVLSGFGAENDRRAPVRLSAVFAMAVVTAVIAVTLMVYSAGALLTASEIGFSYGQTAAVIIEAGAVCAILMIPAARRWAPLISAVFLLRVGLGVNPTASSSLLYPLTPGTEALANAQGEGRVIGLGAALAPDTGMALGVRDARGRDFASLRRYEELVTGRAGDFDFFQLSAQPPSNPQLLGISALAASPKFRPNIRDGWKPVFSGDLIVYRPAQPGRRVLVVPQAVAMLPTQALVAVRSPDFDPKREMVLDDWFDAPAMAGAYGDAHIVSEVAGRVKIQAWSDRPGWLLFLDSWYPGWRAEVNGVPTAVRRADYAFRAVPIPAGASVVNFTYVPFWFWIGLAFSAFAVVGLTYAWRQSATT